MCFDTTTRWRRPSRQGLLSFLVPTVDPENLGANLARENQVFKEGLIRHAQSLLDEELPPRGSGSPGTVYETRANL